MFWEAGNNRIEIKQSTLLPDPQEWTKPDDYKTSGLWYYNNCSQAVTGAEVMADGMSPDSTKYLSSGNNSITIGYGKNLPTFSVWQADICFQKEGAGFHVKNKDNVGTMLHLRSGKLTNQTSSSYPVLKDAKGKEIVPAIGTWYRVTLRGVYTKVEHARVDLYMQAYDENGNLTGDVIKSTNVLPKNANVKPDRIVFLPGTLVDNIVVYEVKVGKVEVTAGTDTIYSGKGVQCKASGCLKRWSIACAKQMELNCQTVMFLSPIPACL